MKKQKVLPKGIVLEGSVNPDNYLVTKFYNVSIEQQLKIIFLPIKPHFVGLREVF